MTENIKTKLIVFWIAADAKGQQIAGNLASTVDEHPSDPTRASVLDNLFDPIKKTLATKGFIVQQIIPSSIIRIHQDVDEPIIKPAIVPRGTMPNLLPKV